MLGSKTLNGAGLLLAMPILLNLTFLGCKDTGTKVENLTKDQSTVSVHLVSDPSDQFRNVHLFVSQVDVKAGGAWQTLAKPERVFDLQKGGGLEEPLAKQVRLPRGSYEHLRLRVDPDRSKVLLSDGTSRPLGLPGTLKGGLIFAVTEGPSTDNLIHDLILNLDAGRSVRRTVDALNVASYLFAPVANLNDRSGLGSLAGRLVDPAGKPMRDVPVMAQNGSGEHGRTLVRTVRTAADGTYKLDLLPVRRMYYVVAQPRVGSALYAAQASPGFKLDRLSRKQTFDFPAFQPATPAAGPKGAVASAVTDHQFDEVALLQHLVTGERQGDFIIHTTQAVPATGGGKATYAFPEPVPGGRYQVRLTRATHPQDAPPHADLVAQHPVEAGGDQPKTVDF